MKLSVDAARYREHGDHGKDLWLNPAFWTVAVYRLRNWVSVAKPTFLVSAPAILVCFAANKFFEIFMGMSISPNATIGPGLYIGHVGGIYISKFASIGAQCDVSHRVTIGVSAMGRPGAPVLGDNVYIGTGATLVGNIRVGNNAKIAANSLVLDDVPEGATVIGVPARMMMGPPRALKKSVDLEANTSSVKT